MLKILYASGRTPMISALHMFNLLKTIYVNVRIVRQHFCASLTIARPFIAPIECSLFSFIAPGAGNAKTGGQGNRQLKRSPLGDLASARNGQNDLELKNWRQSCWEQIGTISKT